MAVIVKNKNEFKKAIDNNVTEIVVEGHLANNVLRERTTGKVAWFVSVIFFFISLIIITYSPYAQKTFIEDTRVDGINRTVERAPEYDNIISKRKQFPSREQGIPKIIFLTLGISLISSSMAVILSKKNRYHVEELHPNRLILTIKEF